MDDPRTQATLDAIRRFNEAFNRHDVDGVMALMTANCVFESTFPAPDGERYEGPATVRSFWERFFASTPQARFEADEIFAAGDRAVVRWIFRWDDQGGHARPPERRGRACLIFYSSKGPLPRPEAQRYG